MICMDVVELKCWKVFEFNVLSMFEEPFLYDR